jgi:hypothetical protein
MRVTVVSLVEAVLAFLVAIFLCCRRALAQKNAGLLWSRSGNFRRNLSQRRHRCSELCRGGDKFCYGLAYVLRSVSSSNASSKRAREALFQSHGEFGSWLA